MTSDLNRRQLLLAGASAWVGMGAANRLLAQPKGEPRRSFSSSRVRASPIPSSPARATSLASPRPS